MRERIKVASWVDFYFLRLDWPAEYYHPAMLRERHFEPAKLQMDRERGLAVSLSTVDDIIRTSLYGLMPKKAADETSATTSATWRGS
jgi:hypothetical protein